MNHAQKYPRIGVQTSDYDLIMNPSSPWLSPRHTTSYHVITCHRWPRLHGTTKSIIGVKKDFASRAKAPGALDSGAMARCETRTDANRCWWQWWHLMVIFYAHLMTWPLRPTLSYALIHLKYIWNTLRVFVWYLWRLCISSSVLCLVDYVENKNSRVSQGISGYLRVLGTVHLVVRLLALWFPTSWMKRWILQAAWLPEEFEEVEACPLVRLSIPFDVWWGLESKHDATPRKSDQKLTQLYQKSTWKQPKNNAETVSPGIRPNMRRS